MTGTATGTGTIRTPTRTITTIKGSALHVRILVDCNWLKPDLGSVLITPMILDKGHSASELGVGIMLGT